MLRAGAPAAVAFAAVAGLSAANGGYFATEWGWAVVGFALVVSTSALVRPWLSVGPWRLGALAALAGFAAWTASSAAWATVGAAHPVLESERMLVYVSALAAFVVVAGAGEGEWLVVGVWAAVTAVCCYALATRLAPDAVGAFDSGSSYQLSEPFGYWNALGMAAALGILLAAGLAAHCGTVLRAAAGASLAVLAPTLYFTFSRGALGALAVGLVALVALDPRRVRLVLTGAAVAAPVAAGVALCSVPDALHVAGSSEDAAAHAGHRVLPALVVLAALAGAAAALRPGVERALASPRLVRGVGIALAALGVAVVLGAAAATPRALNHFREPLPSTGGDLSRRLLSSSGNGRADYWRAAWREVEAHPVLGGGAGSWEHYWLLDRPTAFPAKNAHDLYLETLAELGPLGLALIGVALGLPLVALRRARRRALGPAAGAALVAFLAHAAVDWDWQVTALGVAALACAAALLGWADDERFTFGPRGRTLAVAGALAAALAGAALQVGNSAVAASLSAADRVDTREAERQARRAITWQPWSFEGRQRLAEAQLAAGDVDAARRSLREAISRDTTNWELWYQLALVESGPARSRAASRVRGLNPRAPEKRDLED